MRRVLAFVLLLLGALATVLAATSVWADRSLLDESGWERRATAIADDPAVATAISDAILERVTVPVPAAAERRLRVAVGDLAEGARRAGRLGAPQPRCRGGAAGGGPRRAERQRQRQRRRGRRPGAAAQSLGQRKPALAEVLAQHQAREIVLVKASKLDPLRRATDASDLAPPVLVALAIVLLGLGAITARSASGALAATFVCLLGACAGVLVAFLAARDQALESSKSPLADTIISSTFDTAQRPLAIVVGGACLIALGLVAVVSGLRARVRA